MMDTSKDPERSARDKPEPRENFGMINTFEYRDHKLVSTLDEAKGKALVDALLDKEFEVNQVYKDSRNSYTARIQIGTESLVYKIPRNRLSRLGEKFATLVRDCESVRTFKNLLRIRQLGFNAPHPFIAGYTRQGGFIANSFCCYRFEEGRSASPDDAQQVVKELLALHVEGYTRSDPKPSNFLISASGVSFIDFRLKKPLFLSDLRKKMELARLARVYPEILDYIPNEILNSFSFLVAQRAELKGLQLKQTRRKLRQLFSPKRK